MRVGDEVIVCTAGSAHWATFNGRAGVVTQVLTDELVNVRLHNGTGLYYVRREDVRKITVLDKIVEVTS